MSSITSSHHNISESSQNKLQEKISNIIPIITTSSTKEQPNRQFINKSEKHVEILKTKILIPSRPRTDYCIEPTNEKHTCKTLTCNSYT